MTIFLFEKNPNMMHPKVQSNKFFDAQYSIIRTYQAYVLKNLG